MAERPNQKWVTDISYIRTEQGFLYLSVIRDLYDNSIVAYKTGSEQNVNLVLNTIKAAKRKEKVTAELQLHSDQGFQYTSQAYFKLTQRHGITIHHLICDLMKSEEPRDVRLVYLACAWLVANRGHFLLDAAADKVKDFSAPYAAFCEHLKQDCGCTLPWNDTIPADVIQSIMQAEAGVTRKKAEFARYIRVQQDYGLIPYLRCRAILDMQRST